MSGASTHRLLELLDEVFDGRVGSDEAEDGTLARLPEPLRVLWYLSWLDFEVSQGALHAYFTNSHGRHATQAAAALRTIGAKGVGAGPGGGSGARAAPRRRIGARRAHDIFANQIWFVNCSGSQSFEPVPAP